MKKMTQSVRYGHLSKSTRLPAGRGTATTRAGTVAAAIGCAPEEQSVCARDGAGYGQDGDPRGDGEPGWLALAGICAGCGDGAADAAAAGADAGCGSAGDASAVAAGTRRGWWCGAGWHCVESGGGAPGCAPEEQSVCARDGTGHGANGDPRGDGEPGWFALAGVWAGCGDGTADAAAVGADAGCGSAGDAGAVAAAEVGGRCGGYSGGWCK
jgi:hypothetical protein